ALTCATSTELIAPFAFTSSRKFEPVTATPTCDLVRLTSEALTAPFPFISPTRTHMETGTSPVCGTIIHVKERNSDSLDVGHASEIDRDLRPAYAETAYAPGARSRCRATDRDGGGDANNHLIIVCGRPLRHSTPCAGIDKRRL